MVYDPNPSIPIQTEISEKKKETRSDNRPRLWPVKDKQIRGDLDTVKKMRYFTVTDLSF